MTFSLIVMYKRYIPVHYPTIYEKAAQTIDGFVPHFHIIVLLKGRLPLYTLLSDRVHIPYSITTVVQPCLSSSTPYCMARR